MRCRSSPMIQPVCREAMMWSLLPNILCDFGRICLDFRLCEAGNIGKPDFSREYRGASIPHFSVLAEECFRYSMGMRCGTDPPPFQLPGCCIRVVHKSECTDFRESNEWTANWKKTEANATVATNLVPGKAHAANACSITFKTGSFRPAVSPRMRKGPTTGPSGILPVSYLKTGCSRTSHPGA